MPRIRGRADRRAEGRLHSPGRARRVGQPLQDHEFRQRGERNPRPRGNGQAGLRVQGPEAGQLVLRLWFGAGRGRGRVRRQEVADHRRRLPGGGCRQAGRGLRPGGPGQAGADRHLDHHALDHPRQPGAERASGDRLRAGRCRRSLPGAGRGPGRVLPGALPARGQGGRHRQGRGAGADQLPPSVLRAPVAGVPGRLRGPRCRHRYRPLVAGLRRRRLLYLQALRDEQRRHPQPGAEQRRLRRLVAVLRRPVHLEGQPQRGGQAGRGRQPAGPRNHQSQLHALLAAQDAADLSRHRAVVRRHGQAAQAGCFPARASAGSHHPDRIRPGLGPGASARNDRRASRLVHLAPAQLGRTDPVLPAQGQWRTASTHRGADGRGRAASREGRHRSLVQARRRRAARRGRRAVREDQRHPGRLVRLRHHPLARAAWFPPDRPCQRPGRRSLPGRFRPAPRLVPLLAADRLRDRQPCAVPPVADPRFHRRRVRPQYVQVAGQHRGAADRHRYPGRRHPAPVGGFDRLLGRDRGIPADSPA